MAHPGRLLENRKYTISNQDAHVIGFPIFARRTLFSKLSNSCFPSGVCGKGDIAVKSNKLALPTIWWKGKGLNFPNETGLQF